MEVTMTIDPNSLDLARPGPDEELVRFNKGHTDDLAQNTPTERVRFQFELALNEFDGEVTIARRDTANGILTVFCSKAEHETIGRIIQMESLNTTRIFHVAQRFGVDEDPFREKERSERPLGV